MSWSRKFEEPIPTDGKPLVTLEDAANYIMKLSKAKQRRPEWQAAGKALIFAAENKGPLMFASIGMKKALATDKPARKKAVR